MVRPVVCSDGREFPSMAQAERATGVPSYYVGLAVKGTSIGKYRTAGGLQWAFLEQKPEKWPSSLRCEPLSGLKCKMAESDLPKKEVLRTGDVARILGCTRPTVVRAIERGSLKGFTLPGGTHYRVYRSDLLQWMRENGLVEEEKIVLNWVI